MVSSVPIGVALSTCLCSVWWTLSWPSPLSSWDWESWRVLGPSITNVIIALVFVLTPTSIRTVRSQALAVKEMDYILAARALGATPWRIILRHMVPNCMALFIILATLNLGIAIIVEASP